MCGVLGGGDVSYLLQEDGEQQLEGRGFGVHVCGECAHLGRKGMALGLGLWQ